MQQRRISICFSSGEYLMTYKDRLRGPKEFLDITVWTLWEQGYTQELQHKRKSTNLPQTYLNSNYLLPTCRFRDGRLTGNHGYTDMCCILPVVLAVIKISFIKQAVDDDQQSKTVANILAHKLWLSSKIWRKNWRGSDTHLSQSFFLNVVHVSWEIKSCWEPPWHRTAVAGTSPGWRGPEQWPGYSPRVTASLLPSGGLAHSSRRARNCSVKKSRHSCHF